MNSITIKVAETELTLLPQRVIWWAEKQTLFVADVHLGKDATFEQNNLTLNSQITQNTLAQLSTLIQKYSANQVIVLGDWLHAPQGMTDDIVQLILDWYNAHHAVKITLVMGNHDKKIPTPPSASNVHIVEEPFAIKQLTCWHYPTDDNHTYNLCAHLHPNYTLCGKGRQEITLPCFWQRPNSIVLPAFTEFSGKMSIKPEASDIVYIVTGASVHLIER